MQLNHLDLQVSDVPATAQLFERYFGLRIAGNRTSAAIIILSDDAGFTLVLQRKRHPDEDYPQGFHVGFIVGDEVEVRRKHAELGDGGIGCSAIIENSRGVMFYVSIPGAVTVEVSCRRPAVALRRKVLVADDLVGVGSDEGG